MAENAVSSQTELNDQAKAALPKPEYMAPGEDLGQGTKIQKAYDAAKSWLGEHEKNLSEEYLAPFRQGLDKMAADIDSSPYVKAASPTAQGVVSGVTELMRQVPVGKNVKETALMAASNLPELPEGHIFKDIEGVSPVSAKDVIESQGLIYKGEVVPTSKVHMFEHPDHPGKTASLMEHEITPESVKTKITTKLKDFEEGEKAKQIAKNASGDSAASQEAINRAASEKAKGETYFRIDSRSKKEIPMSSIDGVDAKPGPYERIVKRTLKGDTVMDSGAKALPESVKPSTKAEPKAPPSAKSLEMTKEISKAASDYLATLGKPKE